MAKLEAFLNSEDIKKKYLNRVKKHREDDELVKQYIGQEGKGCAVYCTLDEYNHKAYESELGIPEWLARVEDCIFEGLPDDRSQPWPEAFLSAITPGADLSKIEAPFIIFILKCNLSNFDHGKYPEVKSAIETCIKLCEIGDLEPSAAWSAARSAAESAAWSAAESAARSAAESAAESAARSAAWSAAWSAAESAAWSAAESAARSAAESAARSAAESAAYENFADKLLELLRDCK